MRLNFANALTTIFVVLLVGLAPVSMAANPNTEQAATPQQVEKVTDQPVQAVFFYSNWCGACQILEPKIAAAKPIFSERPVDFIRFDFSFALLKGKSLQALADKKGLGNIYANNKGKVGFVLLVDPKTESVLDVITMRDSLAVIASIIDKRLQRGGDS